MLKAPFSTSGYIVLQRVYVYMPEIKCVWSFSTYYVICSCVSNRAIQQTAMEEIAHTKAGGLSGGQKRRLKIALELLVDRKIMFLDEPTSGLDASSSLELVSILKRLSSKVSKIFSHLLHFPGN